MLIDIENTKYTFSENVYRKMISEKYGIKAPYCNKEIVENKLLLDILDYTFMADGNITQIDITNPITNVTINYFTWNTTINPPQVNADWNATSGAAEILNKPTLIDLADTNLL